MISEFELIEVGPCLLCQDTGLVMIFDPREADPEVKRCPRGCPKQEVKSCKVK
jgi:hypothetical protein